MQFNQSCIVCSLYTNFQEPICKFCISNLPWLNHGCKYCGVHLGSSSLKVCSKCEQSKPITNKIIAVFQYIPPITNLIQQIKFNRKVYYTTILGKHLKEKVKQKYQSNTYPDLIIPVPLQQNSLNKRGFNQSLEIAKSLKLQVPIYSNGITCTRPKKQQATLNLSERKANTLKLFKVSSTLKANHIALVDDVITSGNTLNSLAKAIIASNSNIKIDAWCIAR